MLIRAALRCSASHKGIKEVPASLHSAQLTAQFLRCVIVKFMMQNYSQSELKNRTMYRVAYVLHGYWEEGRGAHTRLFDILIPDFYIELGESINGRGHREHVVPCVYIRNLANKMYSEGKSIPEVATMLNRLLGIVHITKEEAKRLDHQLKLKLTMPNSWCPNVGDINARLEMAGIKLK